MTTVQALLLLSYRLKTGDGLDSRHWTSVAISTAQSIDLFHDTTGKSNLPVSPGFWKRIAWTCYITDCQTALRLRCRPFITGQEFCHQLLTEDDFDLYSVGNGYQMHGSAMSHTQDNLIQRDIINLLISQARLCTTINEVLHLQAERRGSEGSPGILSPPVNLVQDSEFLARVSATEMRLAEWATSFPVVDVGSQCDHPTLFLQRNILHLQFYTAIAVFYQSQPLPSSSFCVKYAAQQITRIATNVHQNNLHNRLPIISVTAILISLIIHVSEIKSLNSSESDEPTQNFHSGLEVMHGLRDLYREARQVTSWASKIMDALSPNESAPEYSYNPECRSSTKSVLMTYPMDAGAIAVAH